MKKKILFVVLLIIIVLLLPLLTKDRSSPLANFTGAELTTLQYTEVSFTNTSERIALGGMLFVPEGEGPFPVAIMIHGSGYSYRNNTWYLALTKSMQDQGIAVLLPDKRGSEKSEGDWIGVTVEQLATDTESAVQFIKDQEPVPCSGIGLVGVSQGGWIAPVVAGKSNDLDFVVDISGTMATGEEQLLFEESHNISRYTYNFIARGIAPITTNTLKKKPAIAAFIDFDPIPYWKKVTIPAFIAYGENDTNCPVKRSLERLEEHQLADFLVTVYPDGKHGILNDTKTAMSEVFLNDLNTFIKKSINPGF